jgi:hypothetical protein
VANDGRRPAGRTHGSAVGVGGSPTVPDGPASRPARPSANAHGAAVGPRRSLASAAPRACAWRLPRPLLGPCPRRPRDEARDRREGPRLRTPRSPGRSPAEAAKLIPHAPGVHGAARGGRARGVQPRRDRLRRGREAFVCEMIDYPFPSPEPLGKIAVLEDTNGDGLLDKRTELADKLHWPTAVLCYDGGASSPRPRHPQPEGTRRRRPGRRPQGSVHWVRQAERAGADQQPPLGHRQPRPRGDRHERRQGPPGRLARERPRRTRR